MKNKIMVIFVTLILAGSTLYAQSSLDLPDPEPYEENEFPAWADNLRRAEIITIGMIPFSLLFTSFGYDVFRYADSGFQQEYAPWTLNNPLAPQLSSDEQVGILVTALSLSVLAGFVDFVLGLSEDEETQD